MYAPLVHGYVLTTEVDAGPIFDDLETSWTLTSDVSQDTKQHCSESEGYEDTRQRDVAPRDAGDKVVAIPDRCSTTNV